MESAEYKKQYDEYLARAEKALSQACERYLPEGSDVCRAARYSLLGGGKRIRAVLVLAVCDMLHGNAEVDVAMVLVIICTHPSIIKALEANHKHRHIDEPWTVVALPHLLLAFFRSNYQELPWLKVMC